MIAKFCHHVNFPIWNLFATFWHLVHFANYCQFFNFQQLLLAFGNFNKFCQLFETFGNYFHLTMPPYRTILSSCHLVILLFFHLFVFSLCHVVILSICQLVNLQACYFLNLSAFQFADLGACQLVLVGPNIKSMLMSLYKFC